MQDDLYRLRIERANSRRPARRHASGGAAAFVGKVTSTTGTPGTFVRVIPQGLTGSEVTNGAGTSTAGSGSQLVYLVGPSATVVGDLLVCRSVDYRWVAERMHTNGASGGGGIGTLPFCFCPDPPGTLAMVSTDPLCNFQMFQSCTITYQPTPAALLPLAIGANNYLSYPDGFPDPVAGGAIFYYRLTCQFNQWLLSRCYITSPYGSPYLDGILVTYNIGAPGNTCADDSLHLNDPVFFPGSDLSCGVSING